MDSVCPIDAELGSEISALLTPPSSAQVDKYLDELIKSSNRNCHSIKVKQNGELSKGVYAALALKEGELLLKGQMLVCLQHSSNKIDCLVCSFCFRFIGYFELQIGRRLYLQELGVSASQGRCQTDYSSEDEDLGDCGPSSSSYKEKVLPKGFAESLMNGGFKLPYSDKFQLPPAVPCHGGCGEAYYCRGEVRSTRDALVKFIQHANDTNDIFLLAAKAVKNIGLVNLFTGSLHVRITLVGPVVTLQWFFYDTIKVLCGLPSSGALTRRLEEANLSA